MRKFKLGVLALGAALAVGVGAGIALRSNKAVSVSADSATLTQADFKDSWSSTQEAQSGTAKGFTLSSTSGAYNSAHLRHYSGATLTLSSSVGKMTEVVFTCTANGTSNYGPGKMSGEGYVASSGKTGTWTGNADSFSLTGGQARITSIAITYTASAVPNISLSKTEISLIEEGAAASITVTPVNFSTTPTISVAGTPAKANVSVNGLTLTVSPKAVGTETLTINAVAGEQNASAQLQVKVLDKHGHVADDPYTVAEAIAAIDAGIPTTEKVYVRGIVSQVDTPSSFSGSLLYYISDDGTTTNQFEIYWGKDIGNVNFPSADAVEVGATVVNYGSIKKYNSTYEFDSGSYLISYTAPVSSKVLQSIALSGEYPTEFYQGHDFSHEGMVVTATYDDASTKDVTSKATFTGYDMATLGQQTVTVSYTEDEVTKTTTYSINVVEYVADTYLLVESVSDLVIGDKVIIAAADSDVAMSTTQNTNNRGQAEVVKSTTDNTLTPTDKVQVFTLVEGNVADSYGFYTGSGYIYAASSSSNHLKTETQLSNNSSFKIEFDSPKATLTAQGSNSRKVMQYNATSSLFSCYASASQGALSLYKKVEAKPSAAEVFAEKILLETQSVCAAYVDKDTDYATQKAALEDIWTTLSSEFTLAALDETELAKLVSAEGKEDGTTIEQAMYRYDFLTAKYGLTNFITGRVIAQSFVGINPAANNANVNMLAIIIIASVALVTTTGAITAIIIKKRVSR